MHIPNKNDRPIAEAGASCKTAGNWGMVRNATITGKISQQIDAWASQ